LKFAQFGALKSLHTFRMAVWQRFSVWS
jgi:hypothetical protein